MDRRDTGSYDPFQLRSCHGSSLRCGGSHSGPCVQKEESTVNLRNIRAIARKEIYHLLRDFRSLYLAFAVPLLLILLFGYALSLDVEHIETVVVDTERTELSRDFISRLGASPYFRIAAQLPDTEAVTQALDHSRAMLAVIIPTGWPAPL